MLDLAQDIEAGAVRQVYVEQHGCRFFRLESRDPGGHSSGFDGLVAPTPQRLRQCPADRLIVINDQNLLSG